MGVTLGRRQRFTAMNLCRLAGRDITSTVDLVLRSKTIQAELVHYRIHSLDHGSDYKPIEIEVDFGSAIELLAQGKRLYRNAD